MALKPPAPRLLPNGGTVLITGSGPSLTREDVEYARRFVDLTIAVNDSYIYAPDADVLYFGDGQWGRDHHVCRTSHTYQGKKFPAFTGRLRVSLTGLGSITDPDVMLFRQGQPTGLSLDPTKLATGKNSAYAALNLSVHLGATKAILLGVDMKQGKVYRDGAWRPSHHCWGMHPQDAHPPYALCLQRFQTVVEPLQRIGFEVVNCTPDSALKCFPMKPLRELCGDAPSAPESSACVQQTSHV